MRVRANSEWKSVLFEAKSKSEAFDLNGAWGGEKDISSYRTSDV